MAFKPMQRPRFELAKSLVVLVLALGLLAHFALNGPPADTPHPYGVVAMTLVTVLGALFLCVMSYRAYAADQSDDDSAE